MRSSFRVHATPECAAVRERVRTDQKLHEGLEVGDFLIIRRPPLLWRLVSFRHCRMVRFVAEEEVFQLCLGFWGQCAGGEGECGVVVVIKSHEVIELDQGLERKNLSSRKNWKFSRGAP